jgi:hypothetical protein
MRMNVVGHVQCGALHGPCSTALHLFRFGNIPNHGMPLKKSSTSKVYGGYGALGAGVRLPRQTAVG